MYLMNGNGIESSGRVLATANPDWQPIAFEDFNDDGAADILIRNTENNSWYLYLMDGFDILEAGRVAATSNGLWQTAAVFLLCIR